MNETVKLINMGLSFFLELAMLAGFGYWGFNGEKSVWLKWTLSIGLPLAAAGLWWLLLAPKAVYRLESAGGTALSLILFLLAATALYLTRHHELAILFAALAVVNRTLLVVWKQW